MDRRSNARMRIAMPAAVLGLSAVGLAAAAPASKADANAGANARQLEHGANWIRNGTVRVSLMGKAVSVHVKQAGTRSWRLMCRGSLIGLLSPPELMQPYRKKYGGYYLFGKGATVGEITTGISNGCAAMSYRTALEDLWIDTRIRILGDSGSVHIDAVGRSRGELVPHWTQTFHQRWAADRWWMPAMTHLLFDAPTGHGWKTISAVHTRESHKFPTFRKYCLSYRPRVDRVWGFLWPQQQGQPAGRRKIQFPPGAITNAYLDAPYVLFADRVPGGADERGVDTVGTELYGRMRAFFEDSDQERNR